MRRRLAAFWTVCRLTAREHLRGLAGVVVPVYLLVLLATWFLPAVDEAGRARLVRSVAVGAATLLVCLPVALVVAGIIPDDRRSGRLAVLLSTPVGRPTYALARLGGGLLLAFQLLLLLFVVAIPFLRWTAPEPAPHRVLAASEVGGRVAVAGPAEGEAQERRPDGEGWRPLVGVHPRRALEDRIRVRGQGAILWEFEDLAPADARTPVAGTIRPRLALLRSFPRRVPVRLELRESPGGRLLETLRLEVRHRVDTPFRFESSPPEGSFQIALVPADPTGEIHLDLGTDATGRPPAGLTLHGRPRWLEVELGLALLSILRPVALVCAVAVAVSTFASTWVAAFAALAAWLTGRLVPTAAEYATFVRRGGGAESGHAHGVGDPSALVHLLEGLAGWVTLAISRAWPDLTRLDAAGPFARGHGLPASFFAMEAATLLPVVGVAAAVGMLVLTRMEVDGS